MALNIFHINTTDMGGGAAKVAYSLKRELEKEGCNSPMLVGRKYSKDSGVKLLNNMQSFSGKVRRKLAYWLANDIDVFSSNHILKTPEFKSADIIHCHNLHSNYFNLGTLEKISASKPAVWTFHDMWPITAHCAHSFDDSTSSSQGGIKENGFFACPSLDIYPPIAWHNERYLESKKTKIYRKSNFHIVTPSKWLAGKVSQSVLKDKPISIIHNGVDIKIFKPVLRLNLNTLRSDLGLPIDKKIILSVVKKQDDQWKGWPFVAEIAEQFKNSKDIIFINIGRIAGNGSNLLGLPPVSDEERMAKYYSAADMLLYPSIADNCPLAVLEAMACGLPVVSFSTGGIPELIKHKTNGYIAEYKNAVELKSGIEYLLNLSYQESEKMRQYSMEKIKTGFTVEKMTEQYINLYEKLK